MAYFPYFEKIKVSLCDFQAVSVSVTPPILTSECQNQSMKLLSPSPDVVGPDTVDGLVI
jgi:hypothetical protein